MVYPFGLDLWGGAHCRRVELSIVYTVFSLIIRVPGWLRGRDMLQLPEKNELDQLSEEKIRMVYALAEKMPDDQLRGRLKDQLRHRLTKIRPLRRLTALRLFCLPFENLLSNDSPQPRSLGTVPRGCANPLWTLVLEHLPDRESIDRIDASDQFMMLEPCPMVEHRKLFSTFAEAVAQIRSGLQRDRTKSVALASKHRDLPGVIEEVHAIYQMRDEITTAKRQILASEQLIGIGDEYASSVVGLARQATAGQRDQRWFKLFFLVLLMDHDLAAYSGKLIETLAEKSASGGGVSIASDLCEAIVARERESLKTGFAMPLMSPADLNAAADQVRATAESLGVMRMASPTSNVTSGRASIRWRSASTISWAGSSPGRRATAWLRSRRCEPKCCRPRTKSGTSATPFWRSPRSRQPYTISSMRRPI